MKNYINEAEELLMHTYSRYQIVFDKGDGVYLYDINGKEYLDFGAGIAVFAFGYNDKEYNDAIKEQVDKLIHISNYFYNVPAIEAAKKLTKATGLDRVFFTNSGTEAIEGAFKLARKYYYKKTGVADGEIIAFNKSFHGRSTGALALTGQPKYQEAFGPLMGGVKFADYNDIDSVKALVNAKTCAILLETVQGEGGIYPANEEFIKEIRKICDENDILLILDEIQCGMGRTGKMFAYEHYNIKPDIVTTAKALGCGIPVGAFLSTNKVDAAFEPGDHGTTYGGNPLACAAISKVLDMYEDRNIIENVNKIGAYLSEKLENIVNKYDFITERRGMGLMQGLEFNKPVKDIVGKCLDNGLILFAAGTNIIRFVPPLIINEENVDKAIEILENSLV